MARRSLRHAAKAKQIVLAAKNLPPCCAPGSSMCNLMNQGDPLLLFKKGGEIACAQRDGFLDDGRSAARVQTGQSEQRHNGLDRHQ